MLSCWASQKVATVYHLHCNGDSLKTIQTYASVADEDLNNMNSVG